MHKLLIFFLLPCFIQAFEGGHCPVGPFGTDGDIVDIDPAKVQFCKNML